MSGTQNSELSYERHYLISQENLMARVPDNFGPLAQTVTARIRREHEQNPDRSPSPLTILVSDHSFTDQALAALAMDCLRQIPFESLSPNAKMLITNDHGRSNKRLESSSTRQRLLRLLKAED